MNENAAKSTLNYDIKKEKNEDVISEIESNGHRQKSRIYNNTTRTPIHKRKQENKRKKKNQKAARRLNRSSK